MHLYLVIVLGHRVFVHPVLEAPLGCMKSRDDRLRKISVRTALEEMGQLTSLVENKLKWHGVYTYSERGLSRTRYSGLVCAGSDAHFPKIRSLLNQRTGSS